jgi:menaquinone-dependent protoporphyrinogen oxidase
MTTLPKAITVLYATREGQTAKIAERVATDLRAEGCTVALHDLRDKDVAVGDCSAVVLAASVHLGKHEKEMVKFVSAHHDELARVPTLFLSVSMSEAGAEMKDHPEEMRAKASENVRMTAEKFFTTTGFRPTRWFPVAGALRYSHYNFLVKFVMKRIAAAEGTSTDTSQDHEYTDWAALDAIATRFAGECAPEKR